jgi:hypothetical protein
MLRKVLPFRYFRVNRRNLSVYLSYFQSNLRIKRNLSAYLLGRVLHWISQR